MKNTNSIAISFLLVCAMVAGSGCNKPGSEFTSDFKVLVASTSTNKEPVLSIGAVTTFSWDKLLVFQPYTPVGEIDKHIGYSWSHRDRVDYAVPEGAHALVFMKTGIVVCLIEFQRHSGDFVNMTNGSVVVPGSDFFKVEPTDDIPSWFKLISIKK